MDDKTLALLGDREAQERLTAAGVLLECPFCGGTALQNDEWIYCDACGVGFAIRNKKLRRRIWNHRAPLLTPEQMALLQIGSEPRKFKEDSHDD